MAGDFPREPVPAEHATRSAATISFVIVNAVIGVPVIILGGALGRDYSPIDAAWVIGLGCTLTAAFAMFTAWAGIRSRCSTALLAERSFGQRGALIFNLTIGIALLGWFAVEMGFVGQLLASGLRAALGIDMPLTAAIVVASLSLGIISVFGITVLARAPLIFVPLLALLVGFVALQTLPQVTSMTGVEGAKMSLGTGISAVIGGFGIGILILPDYSRFIGRTGQAVTAVGLALGPIWALVLGTYTAAGLATGISDPAGMLLALGLPAMITLFLPLGLVHNGMMCLYSSALATSTWLRNVHFAIIVAVTALIGMVLALGGVQSFFIGFLVLTSAVFPPAAAILACEAIFGTASQSETSKVRWINLAVWAAGGLTAIASENWGWGPSGISALDGFGTALLLCFIAIWVSRSKMAAAPS